MKQVEQYVDQFSRVYLFDFEQTKSDRIMLLRLRLKEHGRIFAGRNSIVSLTLKSIGTKSNKDYEHLLKHIKGHKGLLFSNIKETELIDVLDKELPEFREKLEGYALLSPKTSKDNTIKFKKL